ncbi:MAG: hypothetical protein ACR2JB_24045 [Bryobacteraceae bacterium]
MEYRPLSSGLWNTIARSAWHPAGMLANRLRAAVVTMCAFLVLLAISGPGLAEVSTTLPTLTSSTGVRSLTPQEARRGYPIHLRAVVTYFDPITPNMFVQDAKGVST